MDEEEIERAVNTMFETLERIECPLEDYMEALQHVRELIDTRISIVEADLHDNTEGDF